MASTPKQAIASSNSNSSLGKRKKSRGSKSSYLSKWLDKTMNQIQEGSPSVDMYDFVSPTVNWPVGGSQFAPGYDPFRHMYGAPEPMSLPTMPTYYSPPMNPIYGLSDHRYVQSVKPVPVQRPRLRRRQEHRAEEINCHTDPNCNQPKNFSDSQDYASLPPIITSVADTNSISDVNEKEKGDGSNARRFSDPCVRELPDVAQPANGDMDSDSDDDSSDSGSHVGNRLLSCLLDQISTLKLTNERLNKDLMETRAELDNMRQHNAILQKGSTSSMGATPNHSLDAGLIGGQYSPGFFTDLVREIRDAARMREEALYARVRAMVVERTDNSVTSDAKATEKALEEIKSSLRASEADRRRMIDKMNKLEDELHTLRISNGLETNENKMNGNIEEPDSEKLSLHKELADMRKAKLAAEDHVLKLERLITQLRSKFNGHQITNGPDSLPSEPEHETSVRVRRASGNSSSNSTVVFGPVTDL